MKVKIKQLAEQANILDVAWPELGLTPWIKNRNQVEKFAELIVKECIDIANNVHMCRDGRVVAEDIKKHFGVEE